MAKREARKPAKKQRAMQVKIRNKLKFHVYLHDRHRKDTTRVLLYIVSVVGPSRSKQNFSGSACSSRQGSSWSNRWWCSKHGRGIVRHARGRSAIRSTVVVFAPKECTQRGAAIIQMIGSCGGGHRSSLRIFGHAASRSRTGSESKPICGRSIVKREQPRTRSSSRSNLTSRRSSSK